jgi:MFS family permease
MSVGLEGLSLHWSLVKMRELQPFNLQTMWRTGESTLGLKIVIRLFNAPPAMFIRRGSAKSSALESLSFNRESVGNIEHLLPPFEKAGRGATVMARLSVLDRERSVAHPGYSRWLVPPAALAIHLCIGQVYAFSVFKIPLTQLLGVTKSTPEDWKQTQIAWVFSLAIVMLGLCAAAFGKWLEGAGPRKTMLASAVCFALGFYISYLGVITHQLWLIYYGYGFVGGIGLGLGYISPVATLIKWFPDRPGLATGMAIMGFGGGAMIGSPLASADPSWQHRHRISPDFWKVCWPWRFATFLGFRSCGPLLSRDLLFGRLYAWPLRLDLGRPRLCANRDNPVRRATRRPKSLTQNLDAERSERRTLGSSSMQF